MAFARRKLRLKFLVPAVLAFALTLGIGIGLYVHSNTIMAAKIRQEMLTAATVAAMQFRSDALLTLDTPEDVSRTLYKDVASRLNDIRAAVPNAKFVYIFRKTDDPKVLKFVADADAVRTQEELDRNKNGTVDSDEAVATPGEPYDISDQPHLQGEVFMQPLVTPVYQDQWGLLVTAVAPLDDPHFALGIDIDAAEFVQLSQSVLSPAALMLFAFLALLIATYIALYLWRRHAMEKQRIASIRTNVVRLSMHQLGAPLASMRWWLDILREHDAASPVSPEKTEAYANVVSALQRSQELLNTLQSADQSASGGLGDVIGVASVQEAFATAQTELQQALAAKKQVLQADVSSVGCVRMRPDLLKGVLHELLENAITYSPENTSILVRAHAEKGNVVLSVFDSGCGISVDELPFVFDEFHRSKDASKYNSVGGGLGLFVVRNIVEAAGGSASVRSEPGAGAVFTIRLPVA
jgi:signal transduction histidine kinase